MWKNVLFAFRPLCPATIPKNGFRTCAPLMAETRPTLNPPVPSELLQIGEGRAVSYAEIKGTRDDVPTLVFNPGFMSEKWGQKSIALGEFCREKGYSFLTYEFENVGESPGLGLAKTPFHFWAEDAREILHQRTKGPLILVVSSMGTWLATLGARDIFDRVKGIITIGGAFNFLWWYYTQFTSMCTPEVLKKLESGEAIIFKHPRFGDIPMSKLLAESSRQLEIRPGSDFMPKYSGPIRCVHGMKDEEMPYKIMMKDMQKVFPDAQIDFYLRKNGYHRMAEPEDLRLLLNTVEELVAQIQRNS